MSKKPFKHTPEMVKFIHDHYLGTPNKELAEMFNKEFGTSRTAENIKSYKKNHNLSSGLTGHFPKGGVSRNKGMKWDEYMSKEGQANSRKTCFKKGQLPHNTAPIGTERLVKDGYIQVKVTDKYNGTGMARKNWKFKQHIVWEEHYGPVPNGNLVIFLDGDNRNFDISNLACVSKAENIRLNNHKLRVEGAPELTKAGLNIIRINQLINEKTSKGKKGSNNDQG